MSCTRAGQHLGECALLHKLRRVLQRAALCLAAGRLSPERDRELVEGIAADGGLFMPESLPTFTPEDFEGAADIRSVARVLLAPFFAESSLEADLDGVLDDTLRDNVRSQQQLRGESPLSPVAARLTMA